MPSEEEYAREIVRSVEYMSRQLVEFRQDITRATLPLFPRIIGIEKRLDDEAKDRPARQRDLDDTLKTISTRLTNQDQALSQQDKTLAAQDTVLIGISRWQRWRTVIEIAIFIAVVVGFWLTRGHS